MDLTRTDVSYAVTEPSAVAGSCWPVPPTMLPLPADGESAGTPQDQELPGRTVGLMENGTWAPMAAKLMRAELDGMKNITVCDAVVTIRSAANAAAEAQMDVLADELLAK